VAYLGRGGGFGGKNHFEKLFNLLGFFEKKILNPSPLNFPSGYATDPNHDYIVHIYLVNNFFPLVLD
jgi:hypothetical protein